MKSENEASSSLLMGFVLGSVVGAGVALLLAPDSGRETRRRLAETARRVGDGTRETAGDMKDRVQHAAGDMKDKVQHVAGDMKDKVQHIAADVKNRVTHGAQDAVDRGRDAISNT